MQRVLVIVAVIALVVASLGVGALTAHWPFWRRAWAWHAADGGWPSALPGPHVVVRGDGGAPLQFAAPTDELVAVARGARTRLLLRARGGGADAWLAPDASPDELVDGRGLTPALLAALFVQLEQQHAGLLDRPAGAWIDAWRQDVRGAVTPRELLTQVAAGMATPPAFTPLNPFSSAATLAAGPDFHESASLLFDVKPGRADAASGAAAAQVLASIAAGLKDNTFASVLERDLWSTLATADAVLLLDRRHGDAAAHCCASAAAADWLRLGLRLAASHPAGESGGARVISTTGRVLVLAPGPAALLWVGEGDPPSGLETLLEGS